MPSTVIMRRPLASLYSERTRDASTRRTYMMRTSIVGTPTMQVMRIMKGLPRYGAPSLTQ
jgi:hypothetical protein